MHICGSGIIEGESETKMIFPDLLLQLYNTGILAIAIMLLAIAIITYPTLRSRLPKSKRK